MVSIQRNGKFGIELVKTKLNWAKSCKKNGEEKSLAKLLDYVNSVAESRSILKLGKPVMGKDTLHVEETQSKWQPK